MVYMKDTDVTRGRGKHARVQCGPTVEHDIFLARAGTVHTRVARRFTHMERFRWIHEPGGPGGHGTMCQPGIPGGVHGMHTPDTPGRQGVGQGHVYTWGTTGHHWCREHASPEELHTPGGYQDPYRQCVYHICQTGPLATRVQGHVRATIPGCTGWDHRSHPPGG